MNAFLLFLLMTIVVPTPTPQPTSRAHQPPATPTLAPTVQYHDIYVDGGDGFAVALDGGWEVSSDGDGFLMLEHNTGTSVSIVSIPNADVARPSRAFARLLLSALTDGIGATCINTEAMRISNAWYAATAICFDVGYVEDGIVEADVFDLGKGMFGAYALYGNVADEDIEEAVEAVHGLLRSAEMVN